MLQYRTGSYCSAKGWHPLRSELTIPVTDGSGQDVEMGFGEEILSGHVLVVGGTGTGKTTMLLGLAKKCREVYPDARFVFLDIKGDFRPLYRPETDLCCAFYPDEEEDVRYFKWNLLDECMASAHPEDELREMCAKWFEKQIAEGGANRFFPQAAKEILTAYLLTVLRRAHPGSVPTHREMAAQLGRMDAQRMRARLSMDADLGGALANISGSGNTTAAVMAEVHQFVGSLFVGMGAADGHDTVADFLGGPGGKALFLQYALDREQTSNLIFRTLLDRLISLKLSPTTDNSRIFLFLDEFTALKGQYSLLKGLHIGRGCGLRIIAGIQSKEQVYDICPGASAEHTGNTILGAFGSMVAFRPNDLPTLEYIQGRIGEDTNHYMQFGLSRYEAPHSTMLREPLVSSTAINSLDVGEAYVRLRGYDHRRIRFKEGR